MSTHIKTWIINWFKENTVLKEDEIKNKTYDNYLRKGWIDSLKFVSFISDIEERFDIRFSNDEFQDRTFSNIEGLTNIVHRRINEK